jgi:hypothetical protein
MLGQGKFPADPRVQDAQFDGGLHAHP